ncbi:carboxypeptidase M [Ixodes scapularis]|uniref:carboxypeptidase M n=1 Tax=Ixodes scapularis TaxID=6945 RepID=UPI001AD7253D|nr:carboxypeptidase M [Ixodes scapularis]
MACLGGSLALCGAVALALCVLHVKGYRDAFGVAFKYHDYDTMTAVLINATRHRPDLATLYSLGKSGQGRDLWVILLSSQSSNNKLMKPSMKYVANMHGNEMVGKELMLHLIAHLINGYDTDPRINWLLDNTNIHIMPSMNPDGMSISREGQCVGLRGRYNSAGVDLNRNFPDLSLQDNHYLEPETQAVRKWIDSIPFVLSGNLHGGAMLVRYPYDAAYGQGTSASKTPDDDVFQHLSRTYSLNHPTMRRFSCERQQYQDGIVNGAKWYPFKGSMPDYTYIQGGCMEVTLELSCCKYPLAYQLRRFWLDNVKSLLRLLEESHRGVRGIILDDAGYPVKNARLMIKGRYMPFRTSDRGEYWRILLPGRYTLMASSPEHNDLEVPMEVVEGQTTIVNMTLIRKSRSYYPALDDSQLQKTVGSYSNYIKPNIDEDTTDNSNYLSPDNANGFERLSSYKLPGSQSVKEKDSSQSVAGYYQALYEAIRKLTTRDPKIFQQNNGFSGAPYDLSGFQDLPERRMFTAASQQPGTATALQRRTSLTDEPELFEDTQLEYPVNNTYAPTTEFCTRHFRRNALFSVPVELAGQRHAQQKRHSEPALFMLPMMAKRRLLGPL